jgi:hypothetical protein
MYAISRCERNRVANGRGSPAQPLSSYQLLSAAGAEIAILAFFERYLFGFT